MRQTLIWSPKASILAHPQFLPRTQETEDVKAPHQNHPETIANIITKKEIAAGATDAHLNTMKISKVKAGKEVVVKEDQRVETRRKERDKQGW